MRADHKSTKRPLSHQCLFALQGSVCIKSAHKTLTLMKLTPGAEALKKFTPCIGILFLGV